MIRKTIELDNGNTFTELIPENEFDVRRLRDMDNLDDRHSLADDPESLPLETLQNEPPERENEPPFKRKN